MHQIVLLTATYNHPSVLMHLFDSLNNQNDKDFTWIIVNDGSGEETRNALQTIVNTCSIDVQVINKTNGGKSSSINMGLDNLEDNVEFVLIIDDDEYLNADAITNVKSYIAKYISLDCGVIHFNRVNERGEVIAAPPITEDFFMNYQQFKAERRYADGYLGYFTKQLGDKRFTLYEGEKYIAPSTLIMKVTRESKLLWACVTLGETEYLEGGITKQGRKLRVKNPRGMIEYCDLMLENKVSVKSKFVYSVQKYAYAQFLEKNTRANLKLHWFYALPGVILATGWRRKYLPKVKK